MVRRKVAVDEMMPVKTCATLPAFRLVVDAAAVGDGQTRQVALGCRAGTCLSGDREGSAVASRVLLPAGLSGLNQAGKWAR